MTLVVEPDVKEQKNLNPTNVTTKYQLPTPYVFQDIARKRFYRSRSLQQGQRSNQGHTMTLHTYYSQQLSLQSINFLHLCTSLTTHPVYITDH